ncbi:alanine--tRNA ligase [Candidatus Giovannonibacteria bacterium]|nr:alanine--tRNA ligase [Candidatus Giovannonibacteria bacterium]
MNSKELRRKFLVFFESRGHKIVPSSSLIPDDPSVLLTTAGMQQFKPYLTGKADPFKDFGSRNVFSIQKSFRTTDIDEVGDFSHLTFFEMVGNFSFGGYFKETAIPLSFEFLTSVMSIDPKKIFVTAFKGDEEVPRDEEAITLWQEQFKKVGMEAKIGERIYLYGREKNWWEAGPGPAGPDAEMFYDFDIPHDTAFGKECHPNCDCGRFVEIGNDVFVQYNKTKESKYEPLAQKAIDNGRGFERLVMVAQGKKNIFETDLFAPYFELLPAELELRIKRIIVDHLRGSAFLISAGVRTSNKEAGYVLRRLLRRVFVYEKQAKLPDHLLNSIVHDLVHDYGEFYDELLKNADIIREEIEKEKEKFSKTLELGVKELNKAAELDAASAFKLYETYGVPYEIIKEMGGERAVSLKREDFEKEFEKHQEISRAGIEKKFGGHGLILDTGELKAANEEELQKVTRLHTATHLMQAALRKVLGEGVKQAGSDITVERTRFDFSFVRKLTDEELKRVEELVNFAVKQKYSVDKKEMPFEDAVKSGALHFFKEKYPPVVSVYSVGHFKADPPEVFSRELCGGPHVKNTAEIGSFKILKQEAVGSGLRRIRATVE